MTASPAISLGDSTRSRNLHLLIASTGSHDTSWAEAVAIRLSKNRNIDIKLVVDEPTPRLIQTFMTWQNRSLSIPTTHLLDRLHGGTNGNSLFESGTTGQEVYTTNIDLETHRKEACALGDWADLLVLVPLDADSISKMLAGISDTMILRILRGWDTTKKIILVPGMSQQCADNHITRKQMDEIKNDWHWIRTVPPIEWHYDTTARKPRRIVTWKALDNVIDCISTQAELFSLGRDLDVAVPFRPPHGDQPKAPIFLPPEILTMIMDASGDWEMAQALNIYSHTQRPDSWVRNKRKLEEDPVYQYSCELEDVILRESENAVCRKLSQAPPEFTELSQLASKLIVRFSYISVLRYIENNLRHLFKTFISPSFVTMASAYYGRVDVLEYWRNSPSFAGKHTEFYDHTTIDGASKNGFVDVLDWWHRVSGMPFLYTEVALEQASARGDLRVLSWWKDAAIRDESIALRPGKSLIQATRNNRREVIRWWVQSGIAFGHSDAVLREASRTGNVEILELWRQLQGDDQLSYDIEILKEPTSLKHINVLEWWLKYARGELPGMDGRTHPVTYRACQVEEALEDSYGDQSAVRDWWSRHGLNLEASNHEWMTKKCLGASDDSD